MLLVGALATESAFFYDRAVWSWHPLIILENVGWALELLLPYVVFFIISWFIFRVRPLLAFAFLSCLLAVFLLAQTLYIYSYVLRGPKAGPIYFWLFTFPPLGLTIIWPGLLVLGAALVEVVSRLIGRRA